MAEKNPTQDLPQALVIDARAIVDAVAAVGKVGESAAPLVSLAARVDGLRGEIATTSEVLAKTALKERREAAEAGADTSGERSESVTKRSLPDDAQPLLIGTIKDEASGEPARGVLLQAFDDAGNLIGEATSNVIGGFVFAVPHQACEVRVEAVDPAAGTLVTAGSTEFSAGQPEERHLTLKGNFGGKVDTADDQAAQASESTHGTAITTGYISVERRRLYLIRRAGRPRSGDSG